MTSEIESNTPSKPSETPASQAISVNAGVILNGSIQGYVDKKGTLVNVISPTRVIGRWQTTDDRPKQ